MINSFHMHPVFYFIALLLFSVLSLGPLFLFKDSFESDFPFIYYTGITIVILTLLVFLLINNIIGLTDMIILVCYLPVMFLFILGELGIFYNIVNIFITITAILLSNLNKV
jgi:hypothetical protein